MSDLESLHFARFGTPLPTVGSLLEIPKGDSVRSYLEWLRTHGVYCIRTTRIVDGKTRHAQKRIK